MNSNTSPQKTSTAARIAVACGGTGGHVFPGIAAANALAARGCDVAVILSGRSVEGDRPAGWNGATIPVPCRQPRWRGPVNAATSLLSLARAFFTAISKLRKFRPDAVLAMGSYTSVPPVLAARVLRIPVVLHEANAIPGVAVSRLCHVAKTVCIAFEEAKTHLPENVRTVNTGLPIRDGIAGQSPAEYADETRFTVLVMGGSQGSQAVNKAVCEAVALIDAQASAQARPLRIIHLAGAKNEAEVRAMYRRDLSTPVEVIGFSTQMGKLYAASRLCISRAGAASCFELALCGLPALLIPLPGLANDHQSANALAMQRTGACDVMAQSEITPDKLARYILAASADQAKLASMRSALLTAARPDAAEALADCVMDVATHRR